MKLCVHELTASGVEQVLTAPKNTVLVAVRPHLYRHNLPAGTLAIEIRDASDTLLATSNSVNIADIGSDNFYHGYIRFDVSVGLKKDQQYKFRLVGADGYTFDESAYVGWCNDFDLSKYEAGYVPASLLQRPLDLECWERKVR